MSFSDDELKRFREHYDELPVERIEALLARLEAAERVICSYDIFDYKEDRGLLVKKWLQSKGIEGAGPAGK